MLLNDFGFAVDLDPTLLQPFVGHRRFAPNAFLEKLQTTPGALFNYKIQHDLEAAVKVCIVSCVRAMTCSLQTSTTQEKFTKLGSSGRRYLAMHHSANF